MPDVLSKITQIEIENRIFTIRGLQVMLDAHLAELYNVETKRLNEQVKRNSERFPESFMFQLTKQEWDFLQSQNAATTSGSVLRSQNASLEIDNGLKSQNATIENKRGRHSKYLPYVFTEQGVAMLSAVLRSDIAVQVSIQIMQAFVNMRKFLLNNASVFQRLERIELKQIQTDEKFEKIFKALESGQTKPDMGIFFDGQVFDAYTFAADLIKTATQSIVLIDNYIDESVLTLLSKRKESVSASIYTKEINKALQLDLKKHHTQYAPIEVKTFTNSHDRFLIIDNKELYHIGASLKDLGKKWFAFSRMDSLVNELLERIKTNG